MDAPYSYCALPVEGDLSRPSRRSIDFIRFWRAEEVKMIRGRLDGVAPVASLAVRSSSGRSKCTR